MKRRGIETKKTRNGFKKNRGGWYTDHKGAEKNRKKCNGGKEEYNRVKKS